MKKLTVAMLSLCLCLQTRAEEKVKFSGAEEEIRFEDSLKSLDYPELQVVPRASERLASEATYEKDQKVMSLWPFYASSITTIALSSMHSGKYRDPFLTDSQKKESDNASTLGYAVGGTWLAATAYLTFRDSSAEALGRVQKYRGNSKRIDLSRERMAEESLQEHAELMKKLTWLSVVTNLSTDAYILSMAHQDIKYFAGVSIITALLPLLFENHAMTTWDKHQEYRRRIYSPVVSFQIQKGEVTPILVSAWTF